MSELRDKQVRFMWQLSKLIEFVKTKGWEITGGELERDPLVALHNAQTGRGIANSLHLVSLAIDLHLFKDGHYCTASEDYKELGDYWKTLSPDSCWGGDFVRRQDGNHFSIEYNGIR